MIRPSPRPRAALLPTAPNMFTQTWRRHWGLEDDPFVQEDADKDPVLPRVAEEAVHSSFDRLFGDPRMPGPGVVFGEKGSGKSGLRLAMRRRLEGPDSRAFVVEYTEFDAFLNEARKADRLPPHGAKTPRRVVERFGLSDHLDAILCLGVSRLCREVVEGKHAAARSLVPKQKASLLTLAALFHRSDDLSGLELHGALRRALRARRPLALARRLGQLSMVLLGAALIADANLELPFELPPVPRPEAGVQTLAGAALVGAAALWAAVRRLWLRGRAGVAIRAIRVVPRDPEPLARLLQRVPPSIRRDLALPDGGSVGSRLVLLQRFVSILRELGHDSFYVLMDRVDEATMLAGRAELMRPFVEPLLEHRLLQFDGLALKLFLPIELSRLYLGASPEQLKSMRLDKANTIPELRWTGQELAQVASQRLAAVRSADVDAAAPGARLADHFADDITEEELRGTLAELGTPRLAFGFLGAVLAEHARDLADGLPADAPEWRVPRRRFDILRANWLDRARGLRRALN